jgi:biotin carboxyl carrier protein
MKWEVQIGDRTRQVELRRDGGNYAVNVDGRSYRVDAARPERTFSNLLVGDESFDLGISARGSSYTVEVLGRHYSFDLFDPSTHWMGAGASGAAAHGPQDVAAVMPGRVVTILVAPGDSVEAGQGLVVLEAMKMENEVQSPKDGTVTAIHVAPGQTVENGERIATVE